MVLGGQETWALKNKGCVDPGVKDKRTLGGRGDEDEVYSWGSSGQYHIKTVHIELLGQQFSSQIGNNAPA